MPKELTEEQRSEVEDALRRVKHHQTELWDALGDLESILVDVLEVDCVELDANTDYEGYDVDDIITTALPEDDEEDVEPDTDSEALLADVENDAEVVSCPKCGTPHPKSKSFDDEGEGPEAGRTFYYCSERCRETH